MQWIDDSCWYRARISLVWEDTYEVDLQDSHIISLTFSAFLLLPCTSPVQGIIEAFRSPRAMRQLCSQVFRLIWAICCAWLVDEWCWGKWPSVLSKSFWGGLNIRSQCWESSSTTPTHSFTTQPDIVWLFFTVFDKNVKTAHFTWCSLKHTEYFSMLDWC